VDMMSLALGTVFPLWSKTVRLSVGEAKFVRLRMLKNSPPELHLDRSTVSP
jgi:hypothetical protein